MLVPSTADLVGPTAGPPTAAPLFSTRQCALLRRLLNERARRRHESLKLYEPLPAQARFHASDSKQRILRGSNRGGKTLPAAVEIARALTGQDPFGKYPQRDGRCYIVGRDLKHIAETMWHKLSRAGAFKIIRDRVTGQWRAYRPWEPGDVEREAEAKPAPPLIPPRFIQAIAWENKAKRIPSKVTLKNGWEIDFFSSDAKPRRGVDIDLWWIDEELEDEEWYGELVARILDRKGRGVWSATPQTGNDTLLVLSERAREEEGEERRSVEEFVILLADNPHMNAEEKKEFMKSLTEADIEVRIHGEFAQTQRRVFPEFSKALHLCDWFPVPRHYTRYAIIDPGRQVCAVLFAAVPPPRDGKDPHAGPFVYLYDELYIKACSAEMFGQKMRHKCEGQNFEAFVIDRHGARLYDIGGGKSVEQQYRAALAKQGVKSRRTGAGFVLASDDVDGDLEMARAMLLVRDDGTCRLRVVGGRCENFLREIQRYRYKVVRGEVLDKPEDRGAVHQMANFRYLAAYDPKFRPPQGSGKARLGPAVAALRAKQEQERKHNGQSRVLLGPGEWKGERR